MKMRSVIISLVVVGLLAGMTGCKGSQVKSATDGQTIPSQEAQPVAGSANKGAKQVTETHTRETITEWENRFLVYTNFIMRIKSPDDCLSKYREHNYGNLQTQPESVNPEFDLENFNYDDVKEARRKSLGKNYAAFERQIDALIAAMDAFKPTLEALDRYAKSREYLMDYGTFVKVQNDKYIAQATAFTNAYNDAAANIFSVDGIWVAQRRHWIDMVKKAGLRRFAAIHEIKLIDYEINEYFNNYEEIIEFAEIEDNELREHLTADNTQIKALIGQKAEELKRVVDEMHIENAKIRDEHTDSFNKVEDAALQMVGACRQFGVTFDPKSFNESAFDEIYDIHIHLLSPNLSTILKELNVDESYNRALNEIYISPDT